MKKLIFFLAFVLIVHYTLKIEYCSAQWVQVSNGMGNQYVYALANSGNYIFAGSHTNSQGVYLSTNNGNNWTQTSLNDQNIHALLVNGIYIFAGTCEIWSYKSTNNGTNWIEYNLSSMIYSLAVSGNYVYAGTTSAGVYLTTNNGNNWTQTSLNNRLVRSLAANGNYVFAGTLSGYGVYVSTDNGTNWTQSSLNNREFWALAVNGNNVYAGSDSGLYLSTNNGSNWTLTSLNKHIDALIVYGNNIFAGTYQDGFYTSNNNGTNWIQRNEGLGSLAVRSFCISNNYIFAGTGGGGAYRRPLGDLVGIKTISESVPSGYSLQQNYPNPFNPITKIKFDIPDRSPIGTFGDDNIVLKVFDITGKEIATLVNESALGGHPGTYEVTFDASMLTSGVYFYRLTAGDFSETKKMLMIK